MPCARQYEDMGNRGDAPGTSLRCWAVGWGFYGRIIHRSACRLQDAVGYPKNSRFAPGLLRSGVRSGSFRLRGGGGGALISLSSSFLIGYGRGKISGLAPKRIRILGLQRMTRGNCRGTRLPQCRGWRFGKVLGEGRRPRLRRGSFRSFDTLRQAQGSSSGHRRIDELRDGRPQPNSRTDDEGCFIPSPPGEGPIHTTNRTRIANADTSRRQTRSTSIIRAEDADRSPAPFHRPSWSILTSPIVVYPCFSEFLF